jgi:hypothetical protein
MGISRESFRVSHIYARVLMARRGGEAGNQAPQETVAVHTERLTDQRSAADSLAAVRAPLRPYNNLGKYHDSI